MPDYKTYDDLYSEVAKSKPGLTKEQFSTDMSDSQKRFKLFQNLRSVNDKTTPSDYKQFVDYYKFNQPPKKETAPAVAPQGYPTGVQEQMAKEQQQREQLLKPQVDVDAIMNKSLLATGQWSMDKDKLVPKDPKANPMELMFKSADDYYENNFLNPNERKAIPYVNAYYNAKTPYQKDSLANTIKGIIPDWKPLPLAQYQNLRDIRTRMYLNDMFQHGLGQTYEEEKAKKQMESQTTGQVSPIWNTPVNEIQNPDELKKDASAFANMAYLGSDVGADPNFIMKMGGQFAKGTMAMFGIDQQTQDEYNRRATDVLQKNGITLQTKDQSIAANPTTSDVVANAIGQGLGFLLPAAVGGWAGDMARLPEISAALDAQPNALMRIGGKMAMNSLTYGAPMQLADWKNSIQTSVGQGALFSAGSMLIDALGFKPATFLGKILYGALKGGVTNTGVQLTQDTWNAAKSAIMDDKSFTKEFGKYSDGTKSYLANFIAGSVLGVSMEPLTENQKKTAEDELRKDGKKDIIDDANQVQEKITENAPKVNNAVKDLWNQPHNTNPKPQPIQEQHPITVDDDKRSYIVHSEKSIEQKKPSTDKAFIKDFGSGEDAVKELNQYQKDAIKKGLIQKTIQLKNKTGDVIGTRMIVTDPKNTHLGDKIYDLSVKELTQGLTPDEMHTIGALTGEEPVKWLEDAKKQAKNEGVKEQYDNIINDVKAKTQEGNGAKNEVSLLLRQAKDLKDNGHNNDAIKTLQDAEVTAKKYGYKTHWDDKNLIVETPEGRIGEPTLKTENANNLVEAVQKGDEETAKEIANKEGLRVTKVEDNVQVHDGDKLIAQTKNKSIDDFPNKEELIPVLKGIGNSESPMFKEVVQVSGMTNDEMKKGVYDYNNKIPSVEQTKLLDAVNDMLIKGVETDKAKHNIEEFKRLTSDAKPSSESPINYKPTPKINTNLKEGETSIDELKKKSVAQRPIEYKGKEAIPEGIKEEELPRFIAEKSESPGQIIETYKQLQAKRKEEIESDVKSQSIRDAIGREGVSKKSYQQFGDVKKVGAALAKQFFKPEGKGIDVVAQEASEAFGREITPQDVVEYMESPPSEKKRTPEMMALEERFKEITGQPLSQKRFEEYEKLKKSEEGLTKYHKDYEDYISKLTDDELQRESEQLAEHEKGAVGEVQETPERAEEEGVGKSINPEDVTAAGLTTESLEPITKPIGRVVSSALHAMGLPIDVEKLAPSLQPYAKGWNDVKGYFTDIYNSNPPIEEFKNSLLNKSNELKSTDYKTEDERIQGMMSADMLEAWHDAIQNKEDADNIAKIVNQQNSFFVGGKEYYANTLKEIQKLKDFKRPVKPLTRPQIAELKNKMLLSSDQLMNAFEARGEKERVKGEFNLLRAVNKGLMYQSFIHTYAPVEIRDKVRQLVQNVRNPLVKSRHSDMFFNAGLAKTLRDYAKTSDTKKVSDMLVRGHYEGKTWTTDELKKAGLGDNDITLYHAFQNMLDFGKETYKDSYKYYNKFWDMKPDEQKKYVDTYKKYLDENTGYMPTQRGEGEYAVSAWGKNPDTGTEGIYFNKFKTENEARKESERLSKEGYVGVSDEKSDKGYGGRDDTKKPRWYHLNPVEEVSRGDMASVNDLEQALFKTDMSSEDKDKIKSLLESDNLLLTDNERETVSKILEKSGFSEGLREQALESINQLKKKQLNPHFLKRSRDVNGNLTHGFDTSFEGLLKNLEDFNNRAIQNKARAGANYIYDKGKGFLDKPRYKETLKDMDAMMSNINEGSVTSKGMQFLQNAVYYGFLALKPKQVILGLLHTFNTVLPDAGNEIDIINKERVQRGEKKVINWEYLMGAKAIKDQSRITSAIIRGKPMPKDIAESSLGDVINHLGTRGSLQHEFTNYIDGMDATTEKWRLRAAVTGFTDLATRVHAAVLAHDLGITKGLSGDALKDYVEKFVDRNKFQWDKYNAPQFYKTLQYRKDATYGQKIMTGISDATLKNAVMLKSFMFQDLAWNRDYLQRAESKGAAIARVAVPRILASGGIAKTIAAFTGVAGAGLEGLWEALWGKDTDESLRAKSVKLLGKDMGNTLADINTYGAMGWATGTDTRGLMDAGNFINSEIPIPDQIAGAGRSMMGQLGKTSEAIWDGDYSAAMQSLPGEAGYAAKAFNYYNLKQRGKPVYSGSGTKIVPETSDVFRKSLGFNSVDWSKYYTAQGFKHDIWGSGFMPDPNSKAGKIQNEIRKGVDKADPNLVDEYRYNPTKNNFIKTFGQQLFDKIDSYNNELYDHYYTALQSMNPKDFKEGVDILNEVKKYSIGVSFDDDTWTDLGHINNKFVMSAIRKEEKTETK